MKFEDGMTVTIEVTPLSEDTDEVLVFTYKANVVKKFLVFLMVRKKLLCSTVNKVFDFGFKNELFSKQSFIKKIHMNSAGWSGLTCFK